MRGRVAHRAHSPWDPIKNSRLWTCGQLALHEAEMRKTVTHVAGLKCYPCSRLLNSLKGNLKGFYAVTVRANWRVIFRFADRDVFDVDYVDYH